VVVTEHPDGPLARAPQASRPQRTCVGCRGRGDRSVLLRFVAARADGRSVVVPDPRRTAPGRGAWLHPDLACLDLARRRSAFGRALRVAGPVDLSGIDRQSLALDLVVPEHEPAAPLVNDLSSDPGREHSTPPSPSAEARATGSGSER
jgi:predicted RNA-binding protein YlxR (DUF448 family)